MSEGMSTARLKGFVGDSLELLVILSISGLTVAVFFTDRRATTFDFICLGALLLWRVVVKYMFYVPVYGVWKQYKKKQITLQNALSIMRKHYTVFKFIIFYPAFKTYRF